MFYSLISNHRTPASLRSAQQTMIDTDLDIFYTSTSVAGQLIRDRFGDPRLEVGLEPFYNYVPTHIQTLLAEPRITLFRQVATPNHEFYLFLDLAKQLDLKPLVFEYTADKYVCSVNQYKRALGKLPVYLGESRTGPTYQYHSVVDIAKYEGKQISDVKLRDDQPLVDFHHSLLSKLNITVDIVDVSDWFEASKDFSDPYGLVFSLCLRNMILVENYLMTDDELSFVRQKIVPTFNEVSVRYHTKPLICRVLPIASEKDLYWDAYPKVVSEHLQFH